MTHGACRRALLEDRMTAAARHHLTQCSACRTFANALSAVDGWRPGEVPAPTGLADRVVRRVRSEGTAEVPASAQRSWRTRPRRWNPLAAGLSTAAVLGLVLGAGVVLRGGDHQSDAPGAAATSPRPIDPCASSPHCIVIAVDTGGDVVVSGTERQPLAAPCTSLAGITQTFRQKTTAGSIALPIAHSAGGHRLFIGATIQPYAGPGDYASGIYLGPAPAPTTFPFVTIDGRDYASGTPGPPPRYATLKATVRADGSGAVSFRGLLYTQDPSRTVSGLLTWVCT